MDKSKYFIPTVFWFNGNPAKSLDFGQARESNSNLKHEIRRQAFLPSKLRWDFNAECNSEFRRSLFN